MAMASSPLRLSKIEVDEEQFTSTEDAGGVPMGGDLLAMSAGHIKCNFMEQHTIGTYEVWQAEFSNLRIPTISNLRTDPYERASKTSNSWWAYQMHKTFYLYPAIDIAAEFLATFKEFPPRHPAASYTMSNAIEAIDRMQKAGAGK